MDAPANERDAEFSFRVVVIASGPAYLEAAAWAAPTYQQHVPPGTPVSVLMPENEEAAPILREHASRFGFVLERFPLNIVGTTKFTSQLKCHAFLHVVSRLRDNELAWLVDSDTCCARPLVVSRELASAILGGRIGLAPDIRNNHCQNPEKPWYLAPEEQMTYVNSGVILAAASSADLFREFAEICAQPVFLDGPFNDQKVINFAIGKRHRHRLLLLDKTHNSIHNPAGIIVHYCGGAGYFGAMNQRRSPHLKLCMKILGITPPSQPDSAPATSGS